MKTILLEYFLDIRTRTHNNGCVLKYFFLGDVMALVKCKECGAQISSTASTCPQCGKKKPSAGCGLLLLILIAIIVVPLGIMYSNSILAQNKSVSTSTVTTPADSKPIVDYSEAISRYMKTGLLVRVNPNLNEAYVNPYIWDQLDITSKEQASMQLAFYCGKEKGTNLNWVDIKNTKSGKTLAKYSESRGFKVFD